jgi:hypothetical protein
MFADCTRTHSLGSRRSECRGHDRVAVGRWYGANVERHQPGWTGPKPSVYLRAVESGYFQTVGIPLEAGRVFREEDRQAQSALVSHFMAKRLWPNESPIGKQFRIGPETTSLIRVVFEVIGVVGDAHAES